MIVSRQRSDELMSFLFIFEDLYRFCLYKSLFYYLSSSALIRYFVTYGWHFDFRLFLNNLNSFFMLRLYFNSFCFFADQSFIHIIRTRSYIGIFILFFVKNQNARSQLLIHPCCWFFGNRRNRTYFDIILLFIWGINDFEGFFLTGLIQKSWFKDIGTFFDGIFIMIKIRTRARIIIIKFVLEPFSAIEVMAWWFLKSMRRIIVARRR